MEPRICATDSIRHFVVPQSMDTSRKEGMRGIPQLIQRGRETRGRGQGTQERGMSAIAIAKKGLFRFLERLMRFLTRSGAARITALPSTFSRCTPASTQAAFP